jgi:hypothetical protein
LGCQPNLLGQLLDDGLRPGHGLEHPCTPGNALGQTAAMHQVLKIPLLFWQ